jgi:DNA-binding transcriptional MerR regulator
MGDKDKPLSQAQIAEVLGIRPSTIKYYTQLALLPYEQNGAGGHRRYELKPVKDRLELINKLKAKGLNMNGIIKQLAKEGKLYGDPDLFALNLNSKAN